MWHDATERWLFMPRRASAEAWEEEADETRGTNLMLWAEGPARAPPAAAARAPPAAAAAAAEASAAAAAGRRRLSA